MKIYSTWIVGFSGFDDSELFSSFELLLFSKYLLRARSLNQLISLNRLQTFSANVLWRRLMISDRLWQMIHAGFLIHLAIQSDWKYIFYHLITLAHAQVLLLNVSPLTQLNFFNFFVSGNLPASLRLDYQPLFRKWSRAHRTRVSSTHPINKVKQAKP